MPGFRYIYNQARLSSLGWRSLRCSKASAGLPAGSPPTSPSPPSARDLLVLCDLECVISPPTSVTEPGWRGEGGEGPGGKEWLPCALCPSLPAEQSPGTGTDCLPYTEKLCSVHRETRQGTFVCVMT